MRDLIRPAAPALILAAIATVCLPKPQAEAKIRCSKGYQTVGGNQLATPYCQDEYLAQVAREYGMRASGARIRNSPQYKLEVCRLVGRDIRVSNNCLDAFPSGGRRF